MALHFCSLVSTVREMTIVKRQKHSRNNDVDSLELPLREVKLDDNKPDEDISFSRVQILWVW